jgi:hypothetical protein
VLNAPPFSPLTKDKLTEHSAQRKKLTIRTSHPLPESRKGWHNLLPSKIEPFNTADDPNQKTNLADKRPDKIKQLQART